VTSPSSAIPARVLGSDSQATGVVQEELGSGVVLKYVQATAPLRIGDEVVTSGMGGTFPANIPIGTITAIQQSQVDVFQQALLHLNATISADSGVLVITNFLPLQLPTNPT
jgi:rod shape-determining protein MreC